MANSETLQIVEGEILGDGSEIRRKYLDLFRDSMPEFIVFMADAVEAWQEFDKNPEKDEQKAHVSALIFGVINGHLVSTNLFLSGHAIPSGNLERQVLESIATALICSDRGLPFLKQYIQGTFSTNKAIKYLSRHWKRLHMFEESVETAKNAIDFYDKFSHPTLITVAFNISMTSQGGRLLGASFDEGKIQQYQQEFTRRLSLAKTLVNFMAGVTQNWSISDCDEDVRRTRTGLAGRPRHCRQTGAKPEPSLHPKTSDPALRTEGDSGNRRQARRILEGKR